MLYSNSKYDWYALLNLTTYGCSFICTDVANVVVSNIKICKNKIIIPIYLHSYSGSTIRKFVTLIFHNMNYLSIYLNKYIIICSSKNKTYANKLHDKYTHYYVIAHGT